MNLQDVKMNMNRMVRFRGGEYKLVGCMFRQNEKSGEFYYQAELLDLKNGRSVVICKLEEVEEKKNEHKISL